MREKIRLVSSAGTGHFYTTDKNKSARLNLNKFDNNSGKNILKIDFLNLEKDEYLENCYRLENYIN